MTDRMCDRHLCHVAGSDHT